MTIKIRPASLIDATRVADVLIESRKAFLPYAPSAHTEDEVRAWVKDKLLPGEEVSVACIDDTVIGVLAVLEEEGVNWVNQLYIDPGYVNQGIGSMLLRWLFENKAKPFRLYTFSQEANGSSAKYRCQAFIRARRFSGNYL